MDRIGFGVIGCGAIANIWYLPQLQRLADQGIELVAVADVVAEKAEAARARYGARLATTDYREVLERPDIQAVVIATTIATHAPIAIEALRAGKHVLLQKPIATSLAEADQVIAAARASGCKLQVEPAHRLHPLAQRARHLIAEGAIGQVCLVKARSAHGGPPDRPWFYRRDQGGSVVFDMGVHALHWLLAVAGPARRVTAFARTSVPVRTVNGQPVEVDIEDNAVLLLDLQNGALGVVVTNYCTQAQLVPQVEIYGTAGTLYLNAPQGGLLLYSQRAQYCGESGWLVATREVGHQARVLDVAGLRDTPTMRAVSSLEHFIECLRTGRDPVPSGEDARHTLEIMVRALTAAETGQAQTLTTTTA